MANDRYALLRANLKQLRLPTMAAGFEKLAREAAAANEGFEQFLLRLTELEVQARSSKAVQARIRQAAFPVQKDFDTFDFSCVPQLSKPRVLELARGEWIEQRMNVCLVEARARARRTWRWPWAWRRAGRARRCASSARPGW